MDTLRNGFQVLKGHILRSNVSFDILIFIGKTKK
jgi:hypothetical protein